MSVRLSFDVYSCVRVYYRYADCKKCVEVCPVENTIILENDKIKVNYESCINCGACVGNCPTESFKIQGFDLVEFYTKFIEEDGNLISCKLNVPCLSALDESYLSAMCIEKQNDLVLDIKHCYNCSIGKQLDLIKANAEKANYILQSAGVDYRVKLEEIGYEREEKQENKRRAFLKMFVKQTASLAFWAVAEKLPIDEKEVGDKEFKNIVSEKVYPTKREILINALSKTDYEDKYFLVDKIDFSSDKWIDNYKCTNCSVCYNVCPTGALTPSDSKLKVLFSPSLCIKCRICHDVCPEKCIHLEEKLYISDFVSKKHKVLAEHVMIPCSECLVPFSYKGDTTVCPRCRQLEDELRDLLKIGD
ncbi:MAG: 4Fe-4S ferredoxin [Sulfurihydrogenibium sp.]|nr:MAG: 4Fe-4S ferredoxin [Sulfurihydrogenibium sp.]